MAKLGRVTDVDLGDPDLIPIMSIMCILIPMLIYSFVFFEVKVQEVSMPKYGASGGAGGPGMLNLTVVVGRGGFVLKVQEGANPKETFEIEKGRFNICQDGEDLECTCTGEQFEDYNYPELYKKTRELKKKYFVDQNTLNILTLGNDKDVIPFKVFARTIDAVRAELSVAGKPDEPAASFDNLCRYQRATVFKKETDAATATETPAEGEGEATAVAEGGKVPSEMFPKVVFLVQ